MKPIKHIGDLPQPIQVMARSFYDADVHEPEIYEVNSEEFDQLAKGDVAVQKLLWRAEYKYYATLVGDAERNVRSEHIIHDPFRKKVSILAFMPLEEHLIPEWNSKHNAKSMDTNVMEFNSDPEEGYRY